MLETGGGLGLVAEAGGDLGVGIHPGADHLERDQAIEGDLARQVHHAHAALAEDAHDLEARHDRDRESFGRIRPVAVPEAPFGLRCGLAEGVVQTELAPEPIGEMGEPPAELLESWAVHPAIRGSGTHRR